MRLCFITRLSPNQVYYARMWTQLASGDWVYIDSRFSTWTTDVAFLSYPANGEQHVLAASLTGQGTQRDEITLGWNAISDATAYVLWVGTTQLGQDVTVIYTPQSSATNNMLSNNVTLSENQTYYVTLWTQKGSNWYGTQSVLSTDPQNPVSQYGSDPN